MGSSSYTTLEGTHSYYVSSGLEGLLAVKLVSLRLLLSIIYNAYYLLCFPIIENLGQVQH